MDSLGSTVGKGITVTLKGKEYNLSPITIDDLAAFEKYIKSQRLAEFLASSENIESGEKARIIQSILSSPLVDEGITAEMNTISGIRFMLYRALRGNKGIELEKMGEIIDKDSIQEVFTILNEAGGTFPPPPAAEASQ